jgi:hypothetical protein
MHHFNTWVCSYAIVYRNGAVCRGEPPLRPYTHQRVFRGAHKWTIPIFAKQGKSKFTKTPKLPPLLLARTAFPLESFLPACRYSGCCRDAEKVNDSHSFCIMATIDIIRRSDGRTYYPCGRSPIIPTNPKAGTETSGNTIKWNEKTRVTTLIVPRMNPVDIDKWSPQPNLRQYSGPTTYERPPFGKLKVDALAAARKSPPVPTCPPGVPPDRGLCGS